MLIGTFPEGWTESRPVGAYGGRSHLIVCQRVRARVGARTTIVFRDPRRKKGGLGYEKTLTAAAIPNATVKATKEDTNVSRETVSNTVGVYTPVGLDPGRYTVTVTAPGFATVRREGIILQVAEKLNLPITMEVGAVTESVTVVGEQELIQTATASRGLVFDPIKVQEIPLNGRQAYMLMRLSPGVMFTQRTFGSTGYSGTRAWDVNGAFTMNGGRTGTNQFLLNGAPISTQGTFDLAPNVEAVQEMKIMVNTCDAQYGRSGGGHVNTTLRSGTNEWHGKDFIFFSFEGWRERTPFPSVTTVPPLEIRAGNFAFTPAGHSGPILIFDPLTSRPCGEPGTTCISGGIYQRRPFPGNVIPPTRISPVGRNIVNLYPPPNFNPQSLQQNFLRPDNLGRYRYEQPIARWDHMVGDQDRLYVLFSFQDGSEYRNQNGFYPPAETGNMPGTVRRNTGAVVSFDHLISPTKILHVQASVNRFIQNFPNVSDPKFTWDKLGVKNIPLVPTYPTRLAPQVAVSGFSTILASRFVNESSRQQVNFQANVAQTTGRHSMKYGFEWAQLIHHTRSSGNAGGSWSFGTTWSQEHYGRRRPTPLDGSAVADLLLGYLGSAGVPFNTVNPVSDQALANWRRFAAGTRNYPAPPDAIRGGLLYAGVGGQPRRIFDFDYTNLQPRFGLAYNFLSKTVLRGGFGIFHRRASETIITTGFSQSTAYIASVDGGRTHRAGLTGPYSLENPFPDGLIPPLGREGGWLTNIGTSVSFPGRQRPIPRTFQWSYTLERELPWNMVLEVSYVGSLTNKEGRTIQLSDAGKEHWDIALNNPMYFQETLPNPWFGIAPTNTGLGASSVTSRRNLLRRIPQHTGVSMGTNPWGRAWYHGLQVRYEKRMMAETARSGAVTWVLAYTWSKMMENALRQDFTFEWMPFINQVAAEDRSHNLAFAGIWDLPFGKGRAFLNDLGRAGQAVLGGWEFLCGDPPSTNPSDAQFGILPVQQLNFSRNIQLGLRLRF